MKKLMDVLNIVLALCAITITVLVVRRELFSPARGPSLKPIAVAAWERVFDGGEIVGDPAAPVRVIEFVDFECPFCRQATLRLNDLLARFPDKLAVSYRNYPLTSIHPDAQAAAVAAVCAAQQGRFKAMHDALYEGQERLPAGKWVQFAVEAGVADTAQFGQCLGDASALAKVKADRALGDSIGVDRTPAFVIDGKLHLTGIDALDIVADEVEAR